MKTPKKIIINLILILIFSAITYSSSRYYNEGNEEQKRAKVLVFPFLNKSPENRFENYSQKIVNDIIKNFSRELIDAVNKLEFKPLEISNFRNDENLETLRKLSRAYNSWFSIIGEYRILKDVDDYSEKISVKITVYDVRLNLVMFELEFNSQMGLGYYNLIDSISTNTEQRIDRYKQEIETIPKIILRNETNPLNENNIINVRLSTLPTDPTYSPDRGTFSIGINPRYTFMKLEMNHGNMDIHLLTNFFDISYSIIDGLTIGLNLGFIYYNKRNQENQNNDFQQHNRMFNPGFFIKYKILDQNKHPINLSFLFEAAPNLSKYTYSSLNIVHQIVGFMGLWKFGLGISRFLGVVVPYLNVQLWVMQFNDIYDEDYRAHVFATQKTGVMLFSEYGVYFQLSSTFIIDLKFTLSHQGNTRHESLKDGDTIVREEHYSFTPSLGAFIGFYMKADSNTFFNINFEYRFPYKFISQSGQYENISKIKTIFNIHFSFIFRFNVL